MNSAKPSTYSKKGLGVQGSGLRKGSEFRGVWEYGGVEVCALTLNPNLNLNPNQIHEPRTLSPEPRALN